MNPPPDDPHPLVSLVDEHAEFMEEPPPGLHAEAHRSDLDWLKNIYQGHRMPQMTLRAIIMGMLVGSLMSVSNMYVGLKTGWSLGVTITACVIAFAAFKSLEAVIPAIKRNPFNILEDCQMTACASAAGAITAAGIISAIPALYLCTGQPMPWWQIMSWTAAVAMLGLFMAVPLKRQLVNIDRLPFPSGTATAETLRSLHTTGGSAMQQAKCLFGCALFGAALKMWVDAWKPIWTWLGEKLDFSRVADKIGVYAFPDSIPFFPGSFGKSLLKKYTLGFEGSVLMLAAGAIMGIRIGCSLLLGAVVFYGILPRILEYHQIIHIDPEGTPFRDITKWTLWPAVALMVTAGLTSFALRWKTIARSFGELGAIFGMKKQQEDPLAAVESPMWWFLVGTILTGTVCVALGYYYFSIKPVMGVLAVGLTFLLAIVAARATGETDITPIGAMGKITQLSYGAMVPGNLTVNLMTAQITAGAACHCGDLLQAQKTGYLVGATPRKLAVAQFFGVLMGIVVSVPIFLIIVRMPPNPTNFPSTAPPTVSSKTAAPAAPSEQVSPAAAAQKSAPQKSSEELKETETNLMSKEFPAPAAALWKAVADLLAKGLKELPPYSGIAMLIAGLLGIAIALAEEFVPPHCIKWIPSATGLGIAGVINGTNSVMMFLGALIAWIWMKKRPLSGEKFIIAGSSGMIAGESLMGVALKLWEGGPVIAKGIWHSLFG